MDKTRVILTIGPYEYGVDEAGDKVWRDTRETGASLRWARQHPSMEILVDTLSEICEGACESNE